MASALFWHALEMLKDDVDREKSGSNYIFLHCQFQVCLTIAFITLLHCLN
jgi:hypothetical protein